MCKKILKMLKPKRGNNKPISRLLMLKHMCVNCCDYELCLQDNNKCYQYLEEEKRLNVGKEKGLKQRTNNKDL